jgi:hypothetical protein
MQKPVLHQVTNAMHPKSTQGMLLRFRHFLIGVPIAA